MSKYPQYANPAPSYEGINRSSLSYVRQTILFQLVPMIVPSTEGETKFHIMQSKQAMKNGRAMSPNFTTCGALPGWMFGQLGLGKMGGYGLSSVMDAAIKYNCWVDNNHAVDRMLYQTTYGKERRPLPGDIYILGSAAAKPEILHIGVIINSAGLRWWTADAGQGAKALQQALYVPRTYNPDGRKLDGENYGAGTGRPPRTLIGWVDIDRAMNNKP